MNYYQLKFYSKPKYNFSQIVENLKSISFGTNHKKLIFAIQTTKDMLKKKKLSATHVTIYIVIVIGLSVLAGVLLKKNAKKEKPISKAYTECDHVHNANAPIEPSDLLNDPNDNQLIHAQKNGLKEPFKTNDEFNAKINEMVRKTILVQVTENRFYQLKSLTHSQPYLIPEAIDMLNEIGYRFQKRLAEKKYHNYRFRLTSLLRTVETQNSLSHRNGNATKGLSCHLYGTTVDISYKNFYDTNLDSITSRMESVISLTRVLQEMRKECKLLVVRERHQSCFHITVVLCKPTPEKQDTVGIN
jgi:hypothetical protein